MSDRDRRRIVVRKTAAGDPTFILRFSLESRQEKKIPLRINFKVGKDINNPRLNKEMQGEFPVNENIQLLCSYSGSLKQVNIPARVCFNLLENKIAAQSEAEIYYDNIKKVAATTLSLAEKQKVHFHFLDGDENDHQNEVFLTYDAKRRNTSNGIATRDFCLSTDTANNWEIKQVKFKEEEREKLKRYWIKNNRKYLTVDKNNKLVMSAQRSKASMWVCQEARTERYGQDISIYAIKHHVNNTYLLCDTKTGTVFLKKHSMPVFPWYLHPQIDKQRLD